MATKFKRGDQIEVCCNDDGFYNAYYPATVISEINPNEYIIQYNTLLANDELHALREFHTPQNLRPVPPEIVTNKFEINDEVDAFANEGWWKGIVSKKLNSRGRGKKYEVTFQDNNGFLVFEMYSRSELRVHQDWVDGKWLCSYYKK